VPPSVATSPYRIALACTEDRRVGAQVTCVVTVGPEDHDMLWRAAYDPVFATGPVRLGPDGSGTFSFVVPAAALGAATTLELVEWAAQFKLGVAGTVGEDGTGIVPNRIDAGGGPMPLVPMPVLVLLALLAALLAGVQREHRRSQADAMARLDEHPVRMPALDGFDLLQERLDGVRAAVQRFA
jgi:hypothetical protein